jgi:hypothetical protein
VGESEFECGVKGNLHIKAHCRGWCQFFRLAREKYAQMVVLQADGCQLDEKLMMVSLMAGASLAVYIWASPLCRQRYPCAPRS